MMARCKLKTWLLVVIFVIQEWLTIFAIVPDQQSTKHGSLNKGGVVSPQGLNNDSLLLNNVLENLVTGQEPSVLSALPIVLSRRKRGDDKRRDFFRRKPTFVTFTSKVKHFYDDRNAYIDMSEDDIKIDLYKRSRKNKEHMFSYKGLTIVETSPDKALQGATRVKIDDERKMDIYRSKRLPVTQITWIYGLDSKGNPTVEAWGKMGDAEVKFGMYENGAVNHLHGVAHSDYWKGTFKLATFTGKELDMFPPPPPFGPPPPPEPSSSSLGKRKNERNDDGNKENYGEGSSNKRVCRWGPGSRPKRDAGCGCAICLDHDGKVKSVDSKRFVEEYKTADLEGQEKMGKLAKGKMNGEVGDDNHEDRSKFRRKAKNLIELEDIKSHAKVVNFVSNVESGEKSSGKFSKRVEALSTKLNSFKSDVNMKLSNSKIGQKLSSLANSKGGKRFGSAVGVVSKPLGYYFLAKAVINGVSNGDVETLSIIGVRLGYEAAVWGGEKFLSSASSLGKCATKLGKWAGPIGGAFDIGLSVYSIVKSVKRLNNATNQYEQNDAIADIVSDSVDIVATATVVGLSLVFPPAAPLVAVVGIVVSIFNRILTSAYQAQNEVNRINSEIEMLDFEKKSVYWNNFAGFGIAGNYDYLNHLIEEKQANDLAVEHQVDFLNKNEEFLGVVFPSRAMVYDGGCNLEMRWCEHRQWLFDWFCVSWSEWSTVAEKCDMNRECSSCYGHCTDATVRRQSEDICFRHCDFFTSSVNKFVLIDFRCTCEKGAETTFGYPRKNSFVNFHSKQKIYWERTVPKDVEGANFMCKPGSRNSLGYKVHQESSRYDYLCENAIAILQPWGKRKKGQSMLFDLEDGNDTVYLSASDTTPTLFRVGENGTKEFHGGAGKNEFLFDSNCSAPLKGKLEGGPTDADMITIDKKCQVGTSLHFDFGNGSLKTVDGNVDMELKSIENVVGRHRETDEVVAGCHSKRITGRGGNARMPDKIRIPAWNGCSYDLTVSGAEFTNIQSKATRGHITIVVEKTDSSIELALDVHPKDLRFSLIFVATPSAQVVLNEMEIGESIVSFKVRDNSQTNSSGGGTKVELNVQGGGIDQNPPIHFHEKSPSSSQYSTLIISHSNPPVFYHTIADLSKNGNEELRRWGNPTIKNVFQIYGPNWDIVGGDNDDEFILTSLHISNLKLAGRGGDDTLRIIAKLPEIDLRKFSSIENVQGVSGIPVAVICDCDTKIVVGMGGSEEIPDRVTIPSSKGLQACAHRELQVVAKGHSKVVVGDMGENEKISVIAVTSSVPSAKRNDTLRFDLETQSENSIGLVFAIQLSHKNWKAMPGNKSSNGHLTDIRLEGMNGEFVRLVLNVDSAKNEQFLSSPQIQISQQEGDEPTAQFLIERESLTSKVLWHLNKNHRNDTNKIKEVMGFTGIPNMFQVSSGSWRIRGGDANDAFILSSSAQLETISVIGGSGQENVLILEQSENNGTYGVNLKKGEMGYLHANQRGEIRNIGYILGRISQPDSIHVGCHTKSVNGRGGAGTGIEDLIFISEKGCDSNPARIEIFAKEFTKVRNIRKFGVFSYQVPSLLTTDLELTPLNTNQHILKFGDAVWGEIEAIGFNLKEAVLGFKIKTDGESAEKYQYFQMIGESGSEIFSNPLFEFQAQPGIQIKADLHLGKDGATIATILVQQTLPQSVGRFPLLPVYVNRFVIDISGENQNETIRDSVLEIEKADGIFGRSIVGSSTAKANQFWILNLKSSLLQLNGGVCAKNGCTNYLHLGEKLEIGKSIEIALRDDSGYLSSEGIMLISQLTNVHELSGRKDGNDTLLLFSCQLKQASEIEFIVINHDVANSCIFNLTLEIGENTQVSLKHVAPLNGSSVSWDNSVFHYYFKAPVSFDPSGNAWLGPSHHYYLSFTVDDFESIWFEIEQEALYYIINGTRYYHSMLVVRIEIDEQFYRQPQMVLKDGYKINIGRDGSILLVKGQKSQFAPNDIRSKVIPELESTAAKLGVTFMLQTETQMFYVGHANVDHNGNAVGVGDRNVLENSGDSESHLVGGGASDTIYEITSLQKNVFIHTGFETELSEEESNNNTQSKQTIDLTDIVVPIRMESSTKYVPKVKVLDNDIFIQMNDHLNKHPGRICIVNGALTQVAQRLQLLLNNAMMELVPIENELESKESTTQWEIRPRPILIPEGMVYSVSPEDLEDNHQFRVDTNSNTTFQPVKNGADLILTNVASKNDNISENYEEKSEITTVIISDYFEESKVPKSDIENEVSSSETNNDAVQKTQFDAVSGVTISVPGLSLLLNDSKVFIIKNVGNLKDGQIGINDGEEVLNTTFLPNWDSVLRETEEQLLIDMPDIPRVFTEPELSAYPFYFFLGTGLFVLALLCKSMVVIFYTRKLQSKYKGKYSLVQAKDGHWSRMETVELKEFSKSS